MMKEITIFKSVGLAVVDIIVAKYLYEKAVEQGMGNKIEFETAFWWSFCL